MKTQLSKREFQMVELTALGLAQKEIADRLNISTDTVDVTIRHAKEKLSLQKATELTAWYYITRYHITLDLSPITRAMVSLSFLSFITFSLLFGFAPERQFRSMRSSRTVSSRTARRGEYDSENLYTLQIAS